MEHTVVWAADPTKHYRDSARIHSMGRITRMDAQGSDLQTWWRHKVHSANTQPPSEGKLLHRFA